MFAPHPYFLWLAGWLAGWDVTLISPLASKSKHAGEDQSFPAAAAEYKKTKDDTDRRGKRTRKD